uniref:Ribonuclease H1 n=1 Tax=Crassostrea virginica TaxID=6565 RepID=A0A8B8CQB4_CRAVI|nr:ribonuclease H1-like [Crassostrea virginica]
MFIRLINTAIRTYALRGAMPYYAVRRGRNVGIYDDWDSCKAQVHGYAGARYKKFNTQEEAQAFVDGHDDTSSNNSSSNYTRSSTSSSYTSKIEQSSELYSFSSKSRVDSSHFTYTKQKKHTSGHRSRPYSCNSRQYSSSSSSCTATQTGSSPKDTEEDHVYTDGCCLNNGQNHSVAGVGVYWGPNHPSNVSERLPGKPTNNRAEIHAARIAVKQAKEKGMKSVTVVTDSQFLINGMTSWIHNWKRNGWVLSDKTEVKNKEDWKAIDSEMQGIEVKFKHVYGHRGVEGNEAADRLANEGAIKTGPGNSSSWFK